MADNRRRLNLRQPGQEDKFNESVSNDYIRKPNKDNGNFNQPVNKKQNNKDDEIYDNYTREAVITGEEGQLADDIAEKVLSEKEQETKKIITYLKTTFLGQILYEQDENGDYIPGFYEIEDGTLERRFIPDRNSEEHKEVETITDVGFDGNHIYIQDNEVDRYRLNDPIRDPRIKKGLPPLNVTAEDVEKLGKQVANRMGRAWNPSAPIMDVEIGHLRSNFMDASVAPYGVTMAIRVSRASLALRNLADMADEEVEQLLATFMRCGLNLLISGPTGTGKTEMQKALLGYIPDNKKISLMEDTLDSHMKLIYPNKDLNSWSTVKRGNNSSLPEIGFQELIKSGLRNNPDWLMVSEVRGAEAEALLSAALTSHSIMTTLHASGAANIPARITDMVAQSGNATNHAALQRNIVSVLNLGMQLERIVDPNTGKSIRRIKEIYEYVDYDPDQGILGYPLYEIKEVYNPDTETYTTTRNKYRMSDSLIQKITDAQEIAGVPAVFKEGEYKFMTMEDKKRKLSEGL